MNEREKRKKIILMVTQMLLEIFVLWHLLITSGDHFILTFIHKFIYF